MSANAEKRARGKQLTDLARTLASRRAEARRGESAEEGERDMTPAVGMPGAPASWIPGVAGDPVGLHQRRFADARWSYLYDEDTDYATLEDPDDDQIQDAARRARAGELPHVVQSGVMKPAVWTWEVPLYFWFGGIAAGASFVSLACDLSGDEESAVWARRVALAGLVPCPVLLVMDLGRPARFLNMLRIFKVRSPMSMGAWCLTVFGNLAAAAVGADLLGRRRAAQAIGGANAVVGGYLGSYTGVLLAATAVPVWARSKHLLGPIFVATGTLSGAATVRLLLSALGVETGHPTREALARVESGAMTAELVLSALNEHRLGDLADVLEEGTPGRLFKSGKWLARAGLVLQMGRARPNGRSMQHAASVAYLASALAFRYAWVKAGVPSAHDDEAVARTARARAVRREPDLTHPLVVTQHR